jgi:hypothetical protein
MSNYRFENNEMQRVYDDLEKMRVYFAKRKSVLTRRRAGNEVLERVNAILEPIQWEQAQLRPFGDRIPDRDHRFD